MSQEKDKASVYSIPDLKFTSDDALPNYLNSLGFTQSHTLSDTRLALGYAGLAVAGACFWWDLKFGFDGTKLYSLAAVVVYVLLNLGMTVVASIQGNTVYTGTAPSGSGGSGGETVRIRTTSPRYEPVYAVEVTVTTTTGQKTAYAFKRSFAEWFDSAGHFVAQPFQTMLASNVPVIGAADPKRVAAAAAPEASSASSEASPEYSAAMLDILAAASTPGDVSGTEGEAKATGVSSSSKGGKRRKA